MDANSWLLIGLVVLLVVCCVPMLFMRRRHANHSGDHRDDEKVQSAGRR